MKYDNYDRKDLIKIIGKRNNENYKSLFNEENYVNNMKKIMESII